MCVIVAKPAGVKLPDIDTLEDCFCSNPDGAGFMWTDKAGKVQIRKGFMSWDSFLKNYKKYAGVEFTIMNDVVLHFRISTSAKVEPACCHPFPVCRETNVIRQTELSTQVGIAHNGILSDIKGTKTMSDTMLFVKNIMADKTILGCHRRVAVRSLIEAYIGIGNRLAVLDRKGIELYGEGWEEKNGIFFSNMRWTWERFDSVFKYGAAEASTYMPEDEAFNYCGIYENSRCYGEKCSFWDLCVEEYEELTGDTVKVNGIMFDDDETNGSSD